VSDANQAAWSEIGAFAVAGRAGNTCAFCQCELHDGEGQRNERSGEFICDVCAGQVDRELDRMWISGEMDGALDRAADAAWIDGDSEEFGESATDAIDGSDPEQCGDCGAFYVDSTHDIGSLCDACFESHQSEDG
jgi:hypothetical protein